MPIQNQIGLENRYCGAEDIQNAVRRSVCVCGGGYFQKFNNLKKILFFSQETSTLV